MDKEPIIKFLFGDLLHKFASTYMPIWSHDFLQYVQCDQKKLPMVNKSCLKMISLEK